MMSKLLRTKISQDKFGGKDVVWQPDLYTIDEITAKIPLPVLVKVTHGDMTNGMECIARNSILSIHGCRRMETFIATDQQERHMKIPVTCKYEAMVRPNVTIPLCKTAGDVCRQPKIPNFITNEIEFRSHGKIFPAYSTFLVKSVGKGGTLSVVCLTQKAYKTKLDASAKGHFRETVHPYDRNERYLMKDLVNRDLPLSVEFQPPSRGSIIYSPRMGTICLKDLTVNDIVYGTKYENGRRLLVTISRALNIIVQIGHIMVEAGGRLYSTIAEPTEDAIDSEVLEHTLHLDPYSSNHIGIDYELAMQQVHADKCKEQSLIYEPSGNETAAKPELALQALKDTTGSVPVPAIPTQRRHSQETSNFVSSPRLLDPVGKSNTYQELLPAMKPFPTKRRIQASMSAEAIEPEQSYKKLGLKRQTSAPLDTVLLVQKSKAETPPNQRYEEVILHMETLSVDSAINPTKSANAKNHSLAYEEIASSDGNLPTGSTIVSTKLRQMRVPKAGYEEITPHSGNLLIDTTLDTLPVDTALKSPKSTQAKEHSPAYETIASPSSKLPIDTTFTSTDLTKVEAPNPTYEDINSSREPAPVYTSLTASNFPFTEPGPIYAELLPEETEPNDSELSKGFESPTQLSFAAPKEAPRVEGDVIQRYYRSSTNSFEQESVDGEASVAPTNTDQTKSDNVLKKLDDEDVDGICNILDKLQLGEFKENFSLNQIDGELLIDIKDEDLVSDLGMTLFQARKLSLYMRGWKPDEERSDYNVETKSNQYVSQTSQEETVRPIETWLVEEVCKRMLSIKLSSFADFCKENQVNGSLLKGILDHDVIDSIRTDHNIKFSHIEERKLINYVTKGWRPKSVIGSLT